MTEETPSTPSGRQGLPAWTWAMLGAGLVVIAGLVVAVALLIGGGNDGGSAASSAKSTAPKTFGVNGNLTLIDSGVHNDGDLGCWGTGGYDDIAGGAQVVVRDAHGTSVAVGELQNGMLMRGNDVTCVFAFAVSDVPSGSSVYSVEVAHRGEVSFTERDAASPLALTLGV